MVIVLPLEDESARVCIGRLSIDFLVNRERFSLGIARHHLGRPSGGRQQHGFHAKTSGRLDESADNRCLAGPRVAFQHESVAVAFQAFLFYQEIVHFFKKTRLACGGLERKTLGKKIGRKEVVSRRHRWLGTAQNEIDV